MSPLASEAATTAYTPTVDTASIPHLGYSPDMVTDIKVANDVAQKGSSSLLVRRRKRRNRLLAR